MKKIQWIAAITLMVIAGLLLFQKRDVLGQDFFPTDPRRYFDFSKSSIPLEQIFWGGPAKDGIPAILNPEFVPADKADYLKDDERVLGLYIDGIAKAYPVRIMNWHELVNDKFGKTPALISFCPLCGTGMAFERTFDGKEHSFGVSGLLYQSDLLFYDHQTDSLWSQIEGEAVTGKLTGTKLKALPAYNTTWGYWKKKHPDTLALTTNTGHMRDYDVDVYKGYDKSPNLMFPVEHRNFNHGPKEMVIGIRLDGVAKGYLFKELEKAPSPVSDIVGETSIIIHFDKKSRTAFIVDENGKELPSVVGFWFAWYTFNNDTLIYQGSK
ncbi:hypothetical protein MNBD_NITROSPINAE02-477 [hydrothermal vent metagenome]|uniref:DUF3179 domain-containing protein n=1 Tax=hydrothermal vent metagenome TaxID=652676 RepID=A0A3B1CAJ9_9ZZZZ